MSMELLYSRDDTRESENQRIQKIIDEDEKGCTPFPVSCELRDGVWGIWLQAGDVFLLVDPIELVN